MYVQYSTVMLLAAASCQLTSGPRLLGPSSIVVNSSNGARCRIRLHCCTMHLSAGHDTHCYSLVNADKLRTGLSCIGVNFSRRPTPLIRNFKDSPFCHFYVITYSYCYSLLYAYSQTVNSVKLVTRMLLISDYLFALQFCTCFGKWRLLTMQAKKNQQNVA